MTQPDASRERARQSDGQFGEQHRPDGAPILRLPHRDFAPICGNCGGTLRHGYCSKCDRPGDWVADSCDDCGADLDISEQTRGYCAGCADTVGNDGLTHLERAEYAESYRNGPGRQTFTPAEREMIRAWQAKRQTEATYRDADQVQAGTQAAATREDAKIRAEYAAWKAPRP